MALQWYVHRHNVANVRNIHVSSFGDIHVQNELEEDGKFCKRKKRSRGKIQRPLASSFKMKGHQIIFMTLIDEADRQSRSQRADRNSGYEIKIF